jgi:uncharacterized protein YkwD
MARGVVVLALALVAALVTGVRAHAAVADPQPTESPRSLETLEGSVLERINGARKASGLRILRVSSGLRKAATAHARWLTRTGSFTHTAPNGASPTKRIRRYYRGKLVGETLLWGSPTVDAEQALRQWLASPAHRNVLLDRRFREIGVGAVSAENAPGTYGGLDVTVVVADLGTPR